MVVATVDTDLFAIAMFALYYSLGQCPPPNTKTEDGDVVIVDSDSDDETRPPGRHIYILMDGKVFFLLFSLFSL